MSVCVWKIAKYSNFGSMFIQWLSLQQQKRQFGTEWPDILVIIVFLGLNGFPEHKTPMLKLEKSFPNQNEFLSNSLVLLSADCL